jgi:hypothetical protein
MQSNYLVFTSALVFAYFPTRNHHCAITGELLNYFVVTVFKFGCFIVFSRALFATTNVC